MQVQSSWKVAANLELLYGFAHPPVQIHTNHNDDEMAIKNNLSNAGKADVMQYREIKAYNNDNSNVDLYVDARSTCNIDDTFYGAIQDVMLSSKVRHQLIRYYYFMLSKIDLRDEIDELQLESNKDVHVLQLLQENEELKENASTKAIKYEEVSKENMLRNEKEGNGKCVDNKVSKNGCKTEEQEEDKKWEQELEEEEEQQRKEHHKTMESSLRDYGRNEIDNYKLNNENFNKCKSEEHKRDANRSSYSFRARGILTEIHDPSLLSSEALLPWEFYVINTNSTNWEDIDDYDNNEVDENRYSGNNDGIYNNFQTKNNAIRYREQYEDEISNAERVQEYTNAFRALVKEKVSLPAFVRAVAMQSVVEEKIIKNDSNVSNNNDTMKSKNTHSENSAMPSSHILDNKENYGHYVNKRSANSFTPSDSVRKTRNRLSLYTRLTESFTGVYPGMAIGVIGEPFQWSATGVLTGVLVHKFVLPSRPCFPWNCSYSLKQTPLKFKREEILSSAPLNKVEEQEEEENEKNKEEPVSKRLVYTMEEDKKESLVRETISDGAEANDVFAGLMCSAPMRIHFCSGPFPRRDTHALLRLVVRQALTREADLLIIGGPLIKPFEEFDKELLPLINGTFNDLLDGYVDVIEETLQEWRQEHDASHYSSHSSASIATGAHSNRLKVVLIPHRDDVTQVPVLPQTLYALSDTEDIYMRSNPCRLSCCGVHIGVCNEDVVGMMQEQMVERWSHTEGNLRRVVETLIQGRLYAPIMQLSLKAIDVRYLHKLRIDYEPRRCSAQMENTGKSPMTSSVQSIECAKVKQCREEDNWNLLKSYFMRNGNKQVLKNAFTSDKHNAVTVKRAKTESPDSGGGGGDNGGGANRMSSVEFMPHIIFLPSTRPQFAYVTHRGVTSANQHNKLRAPFYKIVDEANIDNVDDATGVLVINQEVWSRRTSARFALRVAEVTISDSRRVALCGARASTGVSCGLLHIFNDNL